MNAAAGRSASNVGTAPPLSDMTLAQFRLNTSETIWNDLVALARQPGVCDLGQGFPDYAGSRVAREAAAAAMVEPSMVRFSLLMARSTEHASIVVVSLCIVRRRLDRVPTMSAVSLSPGSCATLHFVHDVSVYQVCISCASHVLYGP